MTLEARVAVLRPGRRDLDVEQVVLPPPGPSQVVVEQQFSGICHSQLHEIHAERSAPALLGHESTGVVVEVGADVTHVAPGDHVYLTWLPRNPERGGGTPAPVTVRTDDGTEATTAAVWTWASAVVVDERWVVRVDPSAPMDLGAVVGCAVLTGAGAVINTAGVARGDSVAVWGVGGVGLCTVAAAAIAGADPIVAVDLDDAKLDNARRFGATDVVNARDLDAVEAVRRICPPDAGSLRGGADWAFDCIGRTSATAQAITAARGGRLGVAQGGAAVLVGIPTEPITLELIELMRGQARIVASAGGSCQPERDFPIFLDWHRAGRLDLASLVTRRYRLEQLNEACADLEAGRISGRAVLEF